MCPVERVELIHARENIVNSTTLLLKEFLPDYEKYGRSAPLRRNISIIEYSDLVLAFWDGRSRGTKFLIDNCKKMGIPIRIFIMTVTSLKS